MKQRATKRPSKAILCSLLAAAGLAFATPLTAETSAPNTATSPKVTELTYKAGELISFVSPDSRLDGQEAAKEYFSRAFPLASSFGLSNDLTFKVERMVGGHDPDAMIIYSWPSAAAEQKLNTHPDWPAIKALRPKAWNELRVYTTELKEDLTLKFDPSKSYTLAIAWLDPETKGDYQRYFEIIDEDVKKSGGHFIFKITDPAFEAHEFKGDAPGQLTLVEWESEDGFDDLALTDSFIEAQPYFTSAVRKFEFYRLSPKAKK